MFFTLDPINCAFIEVSVFMITIRKDLFRNFHHKKFHFEENIPFSVLLRDVYLDFESKSEYFSNFHAFLEFHIFPNFAVFQI